MLVDQEHALRDCARASLAGEIEFPEVVRRMTQAGVERYHADYSRQEITYYAADGESLVVPSPHASQPTGDAFDAAEIEAAVRASQRGEHRYPDFVRKTMAAGCVGYFVQITGRQAIYFGRRGESHVERFPA
jgi:uncharacterized protein YbcV (DUF1398 family)